MISSRDREVRIVAQKLDQLLDELTETVSALNAILTTPPPDPSGEKDERLVAP